MKGFERTHSRKRVRKRSHDRVFLEAIELLGLEDPRQGVRGPCQVRVLYRQAQYLSGAVAPALLVNVSAGGGGFRSRRPVPVGSYIAVLPADRVLAPRWLRVTHCRQEGPHRWSWGGAWARPWSEPALADWLRLSGPDGKIDCQVQES